MPIPTDAWERHGVYLNTATYGLPPKEAHDAMLAALTDWRGGRTSEDGWEECTERARATFARLTRVRTEDVVCGATISELIGLIAASLPEGSRVLTAENDFASTLFPFTVHEARGVSVQSVPLDRLIESIDGSHALVAVSHVQAYSGRTIDLEALIGACAAHGTLSCVDATQACGWLDTDASAVDFYLCHAYKWLMSPRGSAFMAVRRDRLPRIIPLHAGWWATDDPNGNLFGLPNRISRTTARRLDSSPAWFSWVGTAAALEAIERIGIDTIEAHDMRLARRFCAELGLPAPQSPIVYLQTGERFDDLLAAGIRASVRAGRMRVSFHAYNDDADVDAVLRALS